MPNLEYLNLEECSNLEEVHHSLGCCRKLIQLDLSYCASLKSFPCVNVESLEYLSVQKCSGLKKFPEIHRRMKPEIKIHMRLSGIRELPSSYFQYQTHITKLDLRNMENLVAIPSSISRLKSLVGLNVSGCSKLERFPEEIGDLDNLEKLYARWTLISRPPPSIVRLNKLKILKFSCFRDDGVAEGLRYLVHLDLSYCRDNGVHFEFPAVAEGLRSLEHLDLSYCSLIDGGLPEDIASLSSLKNLDLSGNDLVALPSSICRLKSLVSLDVSGCSKLESLPEEIGDLENLEELDVGGTIISRPPSTIVRLNKLKILMFEGLWYAVQVEFPPVAEGLRSLERLDLSNCNLIDGGLPEDIGSLSSLKNLMLSRNNFERLPRSIAQLGALQYLDLSNCHRLTQLPELPPELNELHLDCRMARKFIHDLVTKRKKLRVELHDAYNDSIYNLFAHTLFHNISSFRHDIFASDSLSEYVFTIWYPERMDHSFDQRTYQIPNWFHHQGWDISVLVDLPENWYIPDKFLGFAVCYDGRLVDTTAELIPVRDDGISCMTQKLALSECDTESSHYSEWYNYTPIQFFLIPLAVLWDTSKANGKTPNDYGIIRLSFSGERKEYGLRLLYKEEAEVVALSQMRENNNEPTEHSTGIRRSRSDNSEHHDSVTDDSSSSFSGEMKEYGLRLLYKEEAEDEALLQMRENSNESTEHSNGIRRSRSDNSEHHDSVTDEASCCRIL